MWTVRWPFSLRYTFLGKNKQPSPYVIRLFSFIYFADGANSELLLSFTTKFSIKHTNFVDSTPVLSAALAQNVIFIKGHKVAHNRRKMKRTNISMTIFSLFLMIYFKHSFVHKSIQRKFLRTKTFSAPLFLKNTSKQFLLC